MPSISSLLFFFYFFLMLFSLPRFFFFFFNDTATTEIYTLSLHDALPIYSFSAFPYESLGPKSAVVHGTKLEIDRKSTRLNSSHSQISYAVFCLKKKKNKRSRESETDK